MSGIKLKSRCNQIQNQILYNILIIKSFFFLSMLTGKQGNFFNVL